MEEKDNIINNLQIKIEELNNNLKNKEYLISKSTDYRSTINKKNLVNQIYNLNNEINNHNNEINKHLIQNKKINKVNKELENKINILNDDIECKNKE